MDVELKPCPWCGEKLTSVRVSEGSTFRWRKVDGCCTEGPEVRHNTLADDQAAAEADSTRRAIEAWNTRHDHSPDAGKMAEDSARLDYIERTFSGMTNRERYLPVEMIWGKGAMGRTLRQAIDKYMAKEV